MPMLPIVIALFAWVLVMVFVAALCAMAARGDRAMGAKARIVVPPRARTRTSAAGVMRAMPRPRVH
jgi:hypothetical protein